MSTPKKPLSQKDKAAVANAMHHIRKWRNRPYWLKIRIDQGPKYIGKDVYVPLKTHNIRVAKRVRDCVLGALRHGGFICLRNEIMDEDQVRKGA